MTSKNVLCYILHWKTFFSSNHIRTKLDIFKKWTNCIYLMSFCCYRLILIIRIFQKCKFLKKLNFSLNFSQQRPLISNFTILTIVKSCCHNFSWSAYIMIFDLSLLKEFSKKVIFQIVTICPLCPEALDVQGLIYHT